MKLVQLAIVIYVKVKMPSVKLLDIQSYYKYSIVSL